MDEHTHSDTQAPATTDPTINVAPATTPTVVVRTPEAEGRSFSLASFVTGFLTAIVLAALALVVFLVVSDSDDDGNIQIEVPAVDVDTGG